MREIKVRAWYKPYKQMCQVESLRFDGNGVYRAVLIEESFYDRRIVEADEIVIEQYTGLKDKNGVNIYEGDILIDDTGEPVEYWVVKFADGGFVGECAGVAESLFELTNLEVVGNIHEDSQLLEEK
jgi:hypothetical protein|nr:MAG TPA: YopX protein [Caudoviricetes sp.]